MCHAKGGSCLWEEGDFTFDVQYHSRSHCGNERIVLTMTLSSCGLPPYLLPLFLCCTGEGNNFTVFPFLVFLLALGFFARAETEAAVFFRLLVLFRFILMGSNNSPPFCCSKYTAARFLCFSMMYSASPSYFCPMRSSSSSFSLSLTNLNATPLIS